MNFYSAVSKTFTVNIFNSLPAKLNRFVLIPLLFYFVSVTKDFLSAPCLLQNSVAANDWSSVKVQDWGKKLYEPKIKI